MCVCVCVCIGGCACVYTYSHTIYLPICSFSPISYLQVLYRVLKEGEDPIISATTVQYTFMINFIDYNDICGQ